MSTTMQRVRDRRAAHESFLGRKYFNALDGLRAVSVLAVIWHHTAGANMSGLLGRGDLGVDFFFAISGFLITTLLLREYRDAGRINLRQFYLRRTLRIFPLYYAVIAVYLALTLVMQRGTPEGQEFLANLPAFLTYTSNWFVTDHSATFFLAWSLATEEQFYLFWPLVLVAGMAFMRGSAVGAGAALLALMIVDVMVTTTGFEGLLVTIITSVATPICCGALLALVLDTRAGFRLLGGLLAWRFTAPLLLLAVLALAATGAHNMLLGVVMACAVAAFCCKPGSSPVLESRPLRLIGAISYGMYLLHVLVMNAIERALHVGPGLLLFTVTLGVTVSVAWVSYKYFETPVRNLGRRQLVGNSSASITI